MNLTGSFKNSFEKSKYQKVYLGMHLAPVITILFLIFPRMILTVFQVIIHNRANRHCLSDQALEE